MNQAQISVNKLALSIVSKAARKRSILKQRKYPDPDFNAGTYHREAVEAIQSYLSDGAIDSGVLTKSVQVLNQQTPKKIGTIRRINSNISSLDRMLEMLDDIDLKGALITLGASSPAKLTIRNVLVSVRPEIVLRGEGPGGKKFVGALKLQMSSSDGFNEEAGGYVSAVLQEYCKIHLAEADEIVNPPYCQVISVGTGSVYSGVKSTAQRMKDIEAECQNISDLWSSI